MIGVFANLGQFDIPTGMAVFMHLNSKIRLDQLLLDQGLASDIKEAGALVMAGKVELPDDRRSPTPGMQVNVGTKVITKTEKNMFREVERSLYRLWTGLMLKPIMLFA